MKGIFVIGAGPAGLFAARKIAMAGYETFVFNRDIKPGGLAEYGIYPLKEKMKSGLRRQFARVLEMPNVHYFGNVQVGLPFDITIDELEAMRPSAMLFACGAQGTKKIGLPGEELSGVYTAKGFVYHYNQLPPYAAMDFSTGARIAIIGMGNVAIDIARWLLEDSSERRAEKVLVIGRRGPFEIKFDEKEIEHVERHISRGELVHELDRIRNRCVRCQQDVSPDRIFEHHFVHFKAPELETIPPRLSFRFLSSPTAILPDSHGRISGIQVGENELFMKDDGNVAATPTGESSTIGVDTVIFAIGDKHDPNIGLPMGQDGFATNPGLSRLSEPSFEVWDPAAGCVLPGRFVAGWARNASSGLVGVARHDGEMGADKVLEFVRNASDCATLEEPEIRARLEARGVRVVTNADLDLLADAEAREARAHHINAFKFADNVAMMKAIDEGRKMTQAWPLEEHALAPGA